MGCSPHTHIDEHSFLKRAASKRRVQAVWLEAPMIESLLLTTARVSTFDSKRPLTAASGFFFERGGRLFLVTSRHVMIDAPSKPFPNRLEIELHTDATNLTRSIWRAGSACRAMLMATAIAPWQVARNVNVRLRRFKTAPTDRSGCAHLWGARGHSGPCPGRFGRRQWCW